MSVQGTRALQVWSQRVTKDYSNVNIVNMTTSWRSGLAFCAIIHHHCPHLIDYHSLDPDDVFGNNSLAFTVAEQHLGIPALLDPLDMVQCELLDRLSILTYLAQLYKALSILPTPVTSSTTPTDRQTGTSLLVFDEQNVEGQSDQLSFGSSRETGGEISCEDEECSGQEVTDAQQYKSEKLIVCNESIFTQEICERILEERKDDELNMMDDNCDSDLLLTIEICNADTESCTDKALNRSGKNINNKDDMIDAVNDQDEKSVKTKSSVGVGVDDYPIDKNPFTISENLVPKPDAQGIHNSNMLSNTLNPFASDLESDDGSVDVDCYQVPTSVSLNPFGSDLDSEEEIISPGVCKFLSLGVSNTPVLKPSRPAPPPPILNTADSAKRQKDFSRRPDLRDLETPDKVAALHSNLYIPSPATRPCSVLELEDVECKKAGSFNSMEQEMLDIKIKIKGLEIQGSKLKETVGELNHVSNSNVRAGMKIGYHLVPEVEDCKAQLCYLGDEMNALLSRQTELGYAKRERRLEELQAYYECETRKLMSKPKHQWNDDDKTLEEKLIANLLQIVSERNRIVECLEMDRLKEVDEDTLDDHLSDSSLVKGGVFKKSIKMLWKQKK